MSYSLRVSPKLPYIICEIKEPKVSHVKFITLLCRSGPVGSRCQDKVRGVRNQLKERRWAWGSSRRQGEPSDEVWVWHLGQDREKIAEEGVLPGAETANSSTPAMLCRCPGREWLGSNAVVDPTGAAAGICQLPALLQVGCPMKGDLSHGASRSRRHAPWGKFCVARSFATLPTLQVPSYHFINCFFS